jgi:two-component system response regulator FixJ
MASTFLPSQYLVFVVDGQERHRVEISALLNKVGYPTRAFASAEDVLAAVDRELPSCVISEVALPGMGGLDLTRALRSRNCLAPVIILTDQSDVPTAVAALRTSVADYLTRPFVERDLVNRLRAALLQHTGDQAH